MQYKTNVSKAQRKHTNTFGTTLFIEQKELFCDQRT